MLGLGIIIIILGKKGLKSYLVYLGNIKELKRNLIKLIIIYKIKGKKTYYIISLITLIIKDISF